MHRAKVNVIVRFPAAAAACLAFAAAAPLAGCEEGEGGATEAPPAATADDGEYQPQSTLGKAKGMAEDTVEMAEDYNDELMKQIEGDEDETAGEPDDDAGRD